jgi:predicted SAM-dependent methyltransferase
MSNFRDKEDCVSFIREMRLNNIDDWNFSQKLLEIEDMVKSYYEEEDYDMCEDCSYKDGTLIEEAKEDAYEEGMNETLEAIKEYVEGRLKDK